MAEYIYTNLPQYVKTNSRTEFSSSVVSSGAVLLFSENGSSLTAKLPDGSFVEVSGGTDVSSTTAEAGDVLSGKLFYTSGGTLTSGTIPTVSATVSGAVVTVPAGYIAASQSISAGVDVSSTTTEAGDVLSGKIFYTSNGTQTSGTIPTVSASLSANITTIPAGYIASSQTLTVPEASSATVAGGVVTIPAGYVASAYTVSAGGSTDYYKCASVTSGGSTWTGYKAVLSGGTYSFESSVTSGLSFGAGFTPAVGQILTDNGLVVIDKLYTGESLDGVFYVPLSSASASAVTGQTLTTTGTVTYQTYQGVPCAYFSGSYIQTSDRSELTAIRASNSFTVSVWANISSTGGYEGVVCGGWGDLAYSILFGGSSLGYQIGGDRTTFADYTSYYSKWTHLCLVGDNGSLRLYIDGVQVGSSYSYSSIPDYSSQPLTIAAWDSGSLNGYLAGVRVFARAISASEIADLAAEFTPTA